MIVKGTNGIVFTVPDTVGTGMLANGTVTLVDTSEQDHVDTFAEDDGSQSQTAGKETKKVLVDLAVSSGAMTLEEAKAMKVADLRAWAATQD